MPSNNPLQRSGIDKVPGRLLNGTVRRMSRRDCNLVCSIAALLAGVTASVTYATEPAASKLAEERVVSLVQARLQGERRNGLFSIRTPTFQPQRGTWWVFLIQKAEPRLVDGDMLAEVNDTTEKVCLQPATAVLKEPCA